MNKIDSSHSNENFLEQIINKDLNSGLDKGKLKFNLDWTKLPQVKIVYWRDIPAQVIAESGKGRKRVQFKLELSKKFMVAIDKAAMNAGSYSTDDYLQDWRRSLPKEISGELEDETKSLAKEIETNYDSEKLRELVMNNGFEKKE